MTDRSVRKLPAHTDLLAAVGVVMVVTMLVIPLPFDAAGPDDHPEHQRRLAIVVATMYINQALEFSVLPDAAAAHDDVPAGAQRLGRPASSSSTGDAGSVIRAFGQFVVGGNFVVGLVIFLILVLIQFIVITKGAGRVAEVAARFTLDAMPGKQMAIDADLNAGLITDERSPAAAAPRSRREADFYGAMDGAIEVRQGRRHRRHHHHRHQHRRRPRRSACCSRAGRSAPRDAPLLAADHRRRPGRRRSRRC